ncbi:hypothetical protein QBC39DRAFT_433070 [Podospora conica]|nr:hypothetical protein QBC39DRAFT_433070 [Schizothecium conicum]
MPRSGSCGLCVVGGGPSPHHTRMACYWWPRDRGLGIMSARPFCIAVSLPEETFDTCIPLGDASFHNASKSPWVQGVSPPGWRRRCLVDPIEDGSNQGAITPCLAASASVFMGFPVLKSKGLRQSHLLGQDGESQTLDMMPPFSGEATNIRRPALGCWSWAAVNRRSDLALSRLDPYDEQARDSGFCFYAVRSAKDTLCNMALHLHRHVSLSGIIRGPATCGGQRHFAAGQ